MTHETESYCIRVYAIARSPVGGTYTQAIYWESYVPASRLVSAIEAAQRHIASRLANNDALAGHVIYGMN